MSAPPPLPLPLLRVYVLGQFRVERKIGDEWSAIDSRIWHRRRARALLGCLLSSPGRRRRLTQPPLNLQPDEMLSAVVERLLKAMRSARPRTVRQFFALVNQHMRWELNDLARA